MRLFVKKGLHTNNKAIHDLLSYRTLCLHHQSSSVETPLNTSLTQPCTPDSVTDDRYKLNQGLDSRVCV